LLQAGLVHDILILRSQDDLLESELVEAKKKIARLCSISEKNIFSLSNFVNVYKIPFWIIESNLISKILSFLNKSRLLDGLIYNLNEKYSRLGLTLNQPELQPRVCRIGIFGKYSSHGDSYLSIIESLRISSFYEKVLVKVEVLDIEKLEGDLSKTLENYDGVIVAPGFGFRGSEKKIEISRQIRIKKIPFIGICLGMQLALIEFARNVLGLKGANSVEFDEKTAHPIFISENNLNVMRKGNREVEFIDNSFLHSVYKKSRSFEIHRHKYKFNLDYLEDFEKAGMFFTGRDKDTHLIVEAVEKSDFFFILTQFHPEFSTSLCSPAPIFNAFLHYIVRNKK